MLKQLPPRSLATLVLALLALFTSIRDASSGPSEFTTARVARRWPTRPILVKWVGAIPSRLPATYQNERTFDGLIQRSFAYWSAPRDASQSTDASNVVQGAGPQFSYGGRLDALPVETIDRLQSLENVDILVVFTDNYQDLRRRRSVTSSAQTYEREPDPRKLAESVSLTATIILVDNAQVSTIPALTTLLAHEAGHAIGLEHTVANWTGTPRTLSTLLNQLPIMTPIPFTRSTLHPDDRAALAGLYRPADFDLRYSTIQGVVIDQWGDPIDGVGVVAVRLPDGRTLPRSLQLHQETFGGITPMAGRYASEKGTFSITAPPGRYRIFVRNIDPEFDLVSVPINPATTIRGILPDVLTVEPNTPVSDLTIHAVLDR